MHQSRDACDVKLSTRQAAVRGPGRLAIQWVSTFVIVGAAAAVATASWIGVDPYDAPGWSDGGPGSGIIVDSVPTHLWLPAPFAPLTNPGSRRAILKDRPAFHCFLGEKCRAGLGFAVTYRGRRRDGFWTDATFVRRTPDEPAWFLELRNVLAGDDAEPDRRASVHVIPEALLRLESAPMIAAMQRIAGEPDLHQLPTRSSSPVNGPTL